MNQLSTTADAVLHVKKARDATVIDKIRAGRGTPLFVDLAKIFGARPFFARPKTVLDAWKSKQLVQLHAEVMLNKVNILYLRVIIGLTYTTALQRSGRKGMSSRFMAMIKGDFATPFPDAIAVTTMCV